MNKSTTGQWITAAISTLVAVAILAAVVMAQQSRTPPSDRLASLESELRNQLELSYREDDGAYRERTAELERTLEAWRGSRQTDRDYALLADWLRASIGNSRPGELSALPATPAFGARAKRTNVSSAAEGVAEVISQSSEAAVMPSGAEALIASADVVIDAPPSVAQVSGSYDLEPAAPAGAEAVEAAEVPELADAGEEGAGDSVDSTPATVGEKSVAVRGGGNAKPPLGHELGAEWRAAEADARVVLNLSELNARIVGYHDGLDEIEAAVVAGSDELSLERAADYVQELEQLAKQYEFSRMYYDLLTERERLSVAAPRNLRPTIELVAAEVERLEAAGDADFLAPAEGEGADAKDQLLGRLRAVAEAVGE